EISLPCARPLALPVAGRGLEPFSFLFNQVSSTGKACLGERAYGAEIDFAALPTTCASSLRSLQIDHPSIAPAPDCPAPGKIPNGDFEGAGGWTATGEGAEVSAGVGSASSRGGRLHHANRCDAPRLRG